MEIARHSDKIILSLILCLAILFLSVVAPLQNANAIAVIDDAIVGIIIVALAAIGITFVTTGAFSSSTEYVRSLMDEFATSQNTTVYEQLRSAQVGTNKLGQLLLNNRFVVYISTFAEWLKLKFNLTNNSDLEVVSAGASINGLTTYETPFQFQYNNQSYEIYTTNVPSFALVQYQSTTTRMVVIVSTYEFTTTTLIRVQSNGQVYTSTFERNSGNKINSASGEVYYWDSTAAVRNDMGYPSNFPFDPSYPAQEWKDALAGTGSIVTNPDSISIVTGTIEIPLDDDNYTDGDGAVIDLDAPWGTAYDDITDDVIPEAFSESEVGTASIEYVQEEEVTEQVEETQETTNLPAGTIPYGPDQLPEFNLPTIWHYVAQWIADASVAMASVISVMTMLPNPYVNLFYATICLVIIFGLIKGLAK